MAAHYGAQSGLELSSFLSPLETQVAYLLFSGKFRKTYALSAHHLTASQIEGWMSRGPGPHGPQFINAPITSCTDDGSVVVRTQDHQERQQLHPEALKPEDGLRQTQQG